MEADNKHLILRIYEEPNVYNTKSMDDKLEQRILIPIEKIGQLLNTRMFVECVVETFKSVIVPRDLK